MGSSNWIGYQEIKSQAVISLNSTKSNPNLGLPWSTSDHSDCSVHPQSHLRLLRLPPWSPNFSPTSDHSDHLDHSVCSLTHITPWEVTSKVEVRDWFSIWQENDWDQWYSLHRITRMYQQVYKINNAGPLTKQQRILVHPLSFAPLRSLCYWWPLSISLLGLFC